MALQLRSLSRWITICYTTPCKPWINISRMQMPDKNQINKILLGWLSQAVHCAYHANKSKMKCFFSRQDVWARKFTHHRCTTQCLAELKSKIRTDNLLLILPPATASKQENSTIQFDSFMPPINFHWLLPVVTFGLRFLKRTQDRIRKVLSY